ncbi:MAG: hypothetical protein AB7C97_09765 [Oscillospiraceae bacterium]
MKSRYSERCEKPLAVVFGALSILFIVLAFADESFFSWVFERHQNQLSWYIRPLFLIPFCFFAYKRSWSGISVTVFLLLTSMFWFPKPDVVGEQIKAFLAMEQEYLTGGWGITKILITLLVPISLSALAAAFWKRSLWLGISVLVFIAVAKMLWSAVFGGVSGSAVIAPAIVGLVICIVLIYIGFRKLEKKRKT